MPPLEWSRGQRSCGHERLGQRHRRGHSECSRPAGWRSSPTGCLCLEAHNWRWTPPWCPPFGAMGLPDLVPRTLTGALPWPDARRNAFVRSWSVRSRGHLAVLSGASTAAEFTLRTSLFQGVVYGALATSFAFERAGNIFHRPPISTPSTTNLARPHLAARSGQVRWRAVKPLSPVSACNIAPCFTIGVQGIDHSRGVILGFRVFVLV